MLILIEQNIYPGGVILLCNIVLCGSYINVGTKGNPSVIMIYYMNIVDHILHNFLLDHAYK